MGRIAVGRTAAVIGIVVLVAVIAFSVMVLTPQLTSQGTSGSDSTTSSGSSSQTSSATGGQLALMAVDPPITASGVTKVLAAYNGLAVHEEGSSNASGWVNLNATGSLDLTGAVNVSKTIAVTKIGAGTYNMVRFNITSATVTYQGRDYPCTVRSGTLTIHMRGNIQVNSSASSAALIDLRTFVINSANATVPQFYLSASAVASSVPPSDVTSANMQVGASLDLNGRAWFGKFESETSTKLTILSATLTSNTLSLTLKKSGNGTANVRTVIVTPVRAGTKANASLPSSFSSSAVFTVNGSGSLQSSGPLNLQSLLGIAGLNITSSSSTTLSFDGTIGLNLGLSLGQSTGVVSGQQYLISVVGDSTFASTIVVAG